MNRSIISQLSALEQQPGLWANVPVDLADGQLTQMLVEGWVEPRGAYPGYQITKTGLQALRAALSEPKP
jgi:hypothetical protein